MFEIVKTISFGGLGDAFIVGRKLQQIIDSRPKPNIIDHLFVESNPKTCSLIREYVESLSNYHDFGVECDSNYQQNYFVGKWKDRRPINTTWHGDYKFPGPDGIKLTNEFANCYYDVCIQVAAGTNSSRHWKFDPRKLRDLLKIKGYKVALVGTAEEYKEEDESNNFVCKTDLSESADVVALSKIYVGLSGFHTYSSLAKGIKNVHLEESPEHNAHYIHPIWEQHRYGIKHGSLAEVITGLRHWGIEI